MTTPPGPEPPPAAPRGGSTRPRSGAAPGWDSSPGDAEAPKFTPARSSPRAPGYSPRADSRDSSGRRPDRDPAPRRPAPAGRGSSRDGASRDRFSREDSSRDSRDQRERPGPRDSRDRWDSRDQRDSRDRREGTARDSFDGGRDRAGRGTARDSEPDGRELRAARTARTSRAAEESGKPAAAPGQSRSGPLRWVGSFGLRRASYVFFGAAVLGAIITVATGSEPGSVLGDLIVLGVVIAALAVERSRVHRLFPLPALTYLVLAVITGFIHDSSAATSTTQLGLAAVQWIGAGFFAMFAATLLVGLILGARMLAARQLVSGSFTMSEPRPAPARGDGSLLAPGGRPGSARDDRRAPKDDADAWYEEPRADTRRPDRDSDRDRDSGRDRQEGREQRPGNRSGRSRGAWTEGWSIGDPLPRKKPAPADRDDESRTRVMPPERQRPSGRKAPEPKPASQPGFSPRESRDSRGSRDSQSSRDSRDRRPGYNSRPGFSPRDSDNGYGPRDR